MTSLYGQHGYGATGDTTNTTTGNYGKQFKEKTPRGYAQFSMQNFTPEQMKLFSDTFGQLSPDSYTSRLAKGDQGIFNEIEAPALKQFNEVQGNIASRFSGMGMGGRNSSGFQNATNQAASDFAQQLQSNRQSLQRNAFKDLMEMTNSLLNQRPYERGLVEKGPSNLEKGLDFALRAGETATRAFAGGA